MEQHLKPIDEALPKIIATVRQSVGLAGQDVNFHKTLDKDLASAADKSSGRILDLVDQLVQNIRGDIDDHVDITKDLVENSWKDIGDVLDGLFEKSDIAYDEHKKAGNSKDLSKDSHLTLLESTTTAIEDKQPQRRLVKPQLQFKKPIDNSETHPFTPKLTSKPNALEPFSESLKIIEATPEVPNHYKQPYEQEIDQQEYPETILTVQDPLPSQDWHKTQPIWVDDVETLQGMVAELSTATEIAVDLEHHDYRTYYGIVCLMQISNREHDWIIDTLALRDDLEPLNTVFTDPSIVKVFHGAFMDIVWLQRDLGLYVVSLFDTYHASRLLGFPKHSLAYLLERFAHFKTSKKYQLADWRIRPLPEAMMAYARSDTHFLLNIFDQLRNQLIQEDKLKDVLYESRKVARKRFEYTSFRPSNPTTSVVSPLNDKAEPWRPLMYQYNLPESKRHILVDLYNWRDEVARKEDESVRYVMPNQLLVSLVADAPTDSHGVLASGNYVTDHVRVNSKAIATIIASAIKKSDDEDLIAMSNAHDAYEALPNEKAVDSDYISTVHHSFESLWKKTEGFSSTDTSLMKNTQGLIKFDNQSGINTFSLEYKGDQIVHHGPEDFEERLKLIDKMFYTIEKEEIVISAAPEEPQQESVVSEVETAQDPTKEEKIDPNEVITLRKHNKYNKNTSRKPIENEEEAFDYSSAKKILTDPSIKERGKKPQTKRSFDPYSQESEGPRAPKKVSRMNQGKTSSFKNRR